MSNTAPIGIFDSGHGGLTVVKQLHKVLPHENVVYFGDLARVPYGSKSPEEIISYNKEIMNFLAHQKSKMILIACNTSSAIALEDNRSEFAMPVLGLIAPAAQLCAKLTKTKKVTVLATQATVKSDAYAKQIKMVDPAIQVQSIACPEFVPLVENDQMHTPEAEAVVKKYMEQVNQFTPDVLIHGCSHYPYLEFQMKKFSKQELQFLDPAVPIVEQAKKILEIQDELNADGEAGAIHYFSSQYDVRGQYLIKETPELFIKKKVTA